MTRFATAFAVVMAVVAGLQACERQGHIEQETRRIQQEQLWEEVR